MEELKKLIIDILYKESDKVYGKGSCGELGDSFRALDSDMFSDVADEILNILSTDFDKAVEPAIRYLFKNHGPHTKIYIDYSTAELLQGQMTHNLDDEIPD